MGMYKSTLGRVNLSGCAVRDGTGDTDGGTTIEQNAALAAKFGVHVEVHTGSNVAQPYWLAVQLQAGRGFSLAGNCSALGKGNVNHNVWVNEARGGSVGHPAEALVYDPWSKGPAWWAWSKVMAFAHALRPWGEGDSRTLANMGVTGVYCGVFPDTEPHSHNKTWNGHVSVRTTPFPDRCTFKNQPGLANVRSTPFVAHNVVATPADGSLFIAYQRFDYGTLDHGTRVWYGDHDGTHWTHESNLNGKGGAS